MKHTPGPWDRDSEYIINEAGAVIALHGGAEMKSSTAEANARLIAAAPDLLAACKAANECIDGAAYAINDTEPWTQATRTVLVIGLRAQMTALARAIAKAEGK